MTQKCRIIIDTNLWISFLLTKRFDFIDKLLDSGELELVFCNELLAELVDVADRPKLRKFFSTEDWMLMFEIIERYAIYVPIVSSVTLCRDAKDNFLLSLAQDARVNYLLTGDNDLLMLKTFGVTRIILITEFQAIIAHQFTKNNGNALDKQNKE
ncbi:MAG: putative toxin-antitoxin system toxin component, PIN family [Bacteroidales bacterium]|nr:putative toxin-antitoxin system toxin component, PIN family [Bacteroidales bacterium]